MSSDAVPAEREYRWQMPVAWWTRNRHYALYVIREFTALPLAIWLLWLLFDISQKSILVPAAFGIFSIICLPFALYHSYTFLKLAGVVLRLKIFDRPVSERLIVLSQFGAWAVASVVIGFLLVWLAK